MTTGRWSSTGPSVTTHTYKYCIYTWDQWAECIRSYCVVRLRHCDVRAPRRVALVTLSLLHLSVSRQSVWVIRGWGGGAEGWWGIKSSGTHGTHTQHPYAASLTSAPAMLDGIVTNNKQITDNQSTLSEVCVFVGLVFRSWWCFCVCVCVDANPAGAYGGHGLGGAGSGRQEGNHKPSLWCPNKALESWMGEGCNGGYEDQMWFNNLIYK